MPIKPIYETRTKLDSSGISEPVHELLENLRGRVIGQPIAIRQFAKAYEAFLADMTSPNRPISAMLFLGPTGTGKTSVVEAFCNYVFKNPKAMLRVDCAEYQRDHEVSKLMGSPPGYVGFSEKDAARLSQDKVSKYSTPECPLSVILFDEIEKATPDLYSFLLGVLDNGKATLGNGENVDFTHSIIIFTSNLGSREVERRINDSGIGFHSTADARETLDKEIHTIAREAAKKHFTPEFFNRLTEVIVFHSLSAASLERILDIELNLIRDRLAAAKHLLVFSVNEAARGYILKEGTSPAYGARELKRALERLVISPLISLMTTGQALDGDSLLISYEAGETELSFCKMDIETAVSF